MHRTLATALLIAAASTTAARADIVYQTFGPSSPVPNNATTFDLNQDGIADLGFFIEHINAPPIFGYVHSVHGLAGLSPMIVSPRPSSGQAIGPTSTFASFGLLGGSHHGHTTPDGGPVTWFEWDPDSPTNSDPVFLGLRLRDAQNHDHYAWLRYNIFNIAVESFDVRLIDYAYQSVPDQPIIAGSVPSPATALPFIAVFCTGRRRPRN